MKQQPQQQGQPCQLQQQEQKLVVLSGKQKVTSSCDDDAVPGSFGFADLVVDEAQQQQQQQHLGKAGCDRLCSGGTAGLGAVEEINSLREQLVGEQAKVASLQQQLVR